MCELFHNWPAENASELTADDISSINEIAFIGLGTEHFEQMTPDAISGITPEQFSNLVGATGQNLTFPDGDSVDGLAVLSGFSAAQAASLSMDIISSSEFIADNLIPHLSFDAMADFSFAQISNIAEPVTASEFLHNWPAENASELTADDISSINEIAFIGLGTEHFEQMTPDAISGITPEQFSRLVDSTGHNLTYFDGDSVDGLAVLSGFSAAQAASLSMDIISSSEFIADNLIPHLSFDAMADFSFTQISNIAEPVTASEFLHNWPAENASELTADDISSINEIAFIGLGTEHFEQMTPDAISGITPEQFSNLVGATGHNLTHFDGDSVDGLAVLSGFSAEQAASLSMDIISSSEFIADNLIPHLSFDAMADFSFAQISNIAEPVTASEFLHNWPAENASELTADDISSINEIAFIGLGTEHFEQMTPDAISGITLGQFSNLVDSTGHNLTHMDGDSVDGLAVLSGFSAEQAAALSSDIISSFGSKISAYLSPDVAQSLPNLDEGDNGSISESSDESDAWGGTSTLIGNYDETEESSIAEGDDIFSSENENDQTSTNPNQNTSEEEASINQAINIIDNSMASETDENMQPSENTSDEEYSDNQQETEENSSDLI